MPFPGQLAERSRSRAMYRVPVCSRVTPPEIRSASVMILWVPKTCATCADVPLGAVGSVACPVRGWQVLAIS